MHARRLAALAVVLAAARAHAQIPETFENLQVFARDVPRADLVQRMREFSFALGVRCTHCHAEPAEGVANPFASDAKPAKAQARAMLRMLADINNTLLPRLPSHATPAVKVDCVICHRGVPIPKTLQTALFELATTEGASSAASKYRELRKTTLDSGRYNFGEWEINELARRLAESGDRAAATTILEMNGEFYPKSASIDMMIADLHLALGDRDKALERYRAALEKAPDNRLAKQKIDELQKKQQ